jgi:hypothetical protein
MRKHARKTGRWILRGALGLVGLVIAAVAAVLIVIHTDWGREQVREQLEAKLADVFVGGAKVGKLEGSPFGQLVLRELVINGPDGQPAISAKAVKLRLALLPLISKEARLSSVILDDAEVLLERDENGELALSRLMKPGPSSGWSAHLADVRVHRAHVSYDTGGSPQLGERVDLDAAELTAEIHAPFERPLAAAIKLTGAWRQRGSLPLELDAALRSDDAGLALGRLYARAGDLLVTGQDVLIGKAEVEGKAPPISGALTVEASRAAVARLGLGFEPPADLTVKVTATRAPGSPWTQLAIDGQLDDRAVNGRLRADLDGRRFAGYVATGVLDATTLSRGQIEGSASALVTFDAALVQGRALPVGTAMIHAHGTIEGVPDTDARIALSSTGVRASALVEVAGRDMSARVAADIERRGETLTLLRGTLSAATTNPERASGGVAPVRGAFHAELTASGALAPRPSLAVAGTVDGRRLRVRDLAIDSLKLAIDARQLPARPLGRAKLEARGVARGTVYLAELGVNAADRPDGKLAVSVRTRPRQSPWLVEADTLVTTGDVIGIELLRHHVRAGTGIDWTGTSGRVAIAPERIEVRDLVTHGAGGSIAVAGTFLRAGRRAGDVEARASVKSVALESVVRGYRGNVSADVGLELRGGRLAAKVDGNGRGITLPDGNGPFDGQAKIDLREGRLGVELRGGGAGLGRAGLVAEIAAPRDTANPRAWQALDQTAIRDARLTLERIDLARVAALAHLFGEHRGLIDGELRLAAGAPSGAITARGVMTPATRELGRVDADFQLAQTPRGELAPALAVRVEGLGSLDARATIALPARPLDPLAWRRLGRAAITGAQVRTSELAFDPAMLDRFGVASNLRGRASLAVEVDAGVRAARVTGRVRELRGAPIAEPLDVQLTAAAGEDATTFQLAAGTAATRFIEASGRIPRTLTQLQAGGAALRGAPVAATIKIPAVSAPRLLAAFGRTDAIGGTLDGTIEVGGTVSAPTGRARITASHITVPQQSRARTSKPLDQLVIDARWDGRVGSVELTGVQPGGQLRVLAKGSPEALKDATISLRASQFDLRPLLVFVPGAVGASGGTLDANLTVAGLDPQTARIAGELHLDHGRVPIAPTVGTLRAAKLDLVAGQRDLRIKLDGKLGGGTVKASGSIGLVGAAPTGGDLTLTLRKVSPIGAVEPVIDADVTAKLRKGQDRWIADVSVQNGSVEVPKGRGEQLKPIGPPEDMVFLSGDPGGKRGRAETPPSQPVFEARVTLGPTHIKTQEVRGVIRGKVTITIDGDAIGLVGGIEAYRGDLDLFGHRYLVERAAARFDGSLDPLLDAVITHDFPEVTTITSVRGRLSKPELIMSSDPSIYSQSQLLGFLLGGEPNGEPATGNARDRVTSAGTSLIANQIGGYFKDALPFNLDVLRYEAATASSSAAFTVGTWLSRSLFVSYRRRFEARADENTGEAEAEYWLTRRVMVEGTLGDRGYSGLDLLWRKRY